MTTETSLGFDKYKPIEFQQRKERERLFSHINQAQLTYKKQENTLKYNVKIDFNRRYIGSSKAKARQSYRRRNYLIQRARTALCCLHLIFSIE